MCQMCDEYEAELRRMGIAMDEKVTVELDRETLDVLEQDARAHGQSLDDEVKHVLREHAARERLRRDPVEWSRQIRAMTPTNVPQTDSMVLLREDRDR